MINTGENKIFIVLPAYNASKTLMRTLDEIPVVYRQNIILVDDASTDDTVEVAQKAGLTVIVHPQNRGYGGNQKTCYTESLKRGAELVVMLHPDHQYDAKVIPQLIKPILAGEATAVFGSRMLGGHPLEGGMPMWKYVANVLLTATANIIFRRYLTEIHSGFRAWSPGDVAAAIMAAVGTRTAYLSFDIDCLDPAFAPGTGTPVPGGLSSHQALSILRRLKEVDFAGMDLVEVSPPYDHAETTSLAACAVMLEYLCLKAWQRGAREPGHSTTR